MSEYQDGTRGTDDGYVHDTIKDHEFDGIQEFDNKLPNWWLWILYGSIVFSLFYWLVFHTLEIRPLPRQELATEMQIIAEEELAKALALGLSNETFVDMVAMENKLAEGREVWVKHCVACHLDDGRGLVGPNLTDNMWVHGCEPMQIYNTVKDGVAAKGMPAWMNQLGPNRVMSVVAYVMTISDDNVTGKEPEGEPCTF